MTRRSPSPASSLPSVHSLLQEDGLVGLPRPLALAAVRRVIEGARQETLGGAPTPARRALVEQAIALVEQSSRSTYFRVLNATGVVLHTNLGRAPLAAEAMEGIQGLASGYCSVELDISTGQRGQRLDGVVGHLTHLTGAEDAVVVNNNAAAVLLCLTALARDRKVVVSRGELVEIGGAFRIPEVVAAGGAGLVEVGCTNRTRVGDYREALRADDGITGVLRVHPSNFRMVGFVEQPGRGELASLARESGRWLLEDLGSGNLWPELAWEPTVREVVEDGVDLVSFSGDKLLGGPQAGIVVGRANLVERLRRHPMYRALRVDKLVLAALEVTLRLSLAGRFQEIPALRMLTMGRDAVRERCEALVAATGGLPLRARCRDTEGRVGAGAMPHRPLPSAAVAVTVDGVPPSRLARLLREGRPAVLGRVEDGELLLDPRTLLPGEEQELVAALKAAVTRATRES